jgi:hypothetical protein
MSAAAEHHLGEINEQESGNERELDYTKYLGHLMFLAHGYASQIRI